MNKSQKESEEKPKKPHKKPAPSNPLDRYMPLEEDWAPEARINKKDLDWLL